MLPRTIQGLLITALVALIVALLVLSGWADDKADPGSRGRVQVTSPADREPSRPSR